MKEITLTNGMITQVDDSDFEYLSQFKWRGTFHHGVWRAEMSKKFNGKSHNWMHRLIMNLEDPNLFVDHKDGDGLNNQKSNLRICTQPQNSRNRKANTGSSSKYVGVTKIINKKHGVSWCATISVNGKMIQIGTFNTEEDAAVARDRESEKYNGEFVRLNIPERKDTPKRNDLKIHNTSGFIGVSFDKRHNKWMAQLAINKKKVLNTRHNDKYSAAADYDMAKLKYCGVDSKVNLACSKINYIAEQLKQKI